GHQPGDGRSARSRRRSGPLRRDSRPDPTGPRFIRPLRDFLRTESAGGVALVAATVVALVWANSPWKASYFDLWNTHLSVSLGARTLDLTLRDWINDGLMALFFFVVGLEIKRELVEGELRAPRRAALPVIAALGGMLVPAAIYLAINAGGDAVDGWGIPMATDIAMAVGIMSLLGSRVAASLKLFLLALAIVDDIGAIFVIAIFYAEAIHYDALVVTIAIAVAVIVLRRLGVWYTPLYAVLGISMWFFLHESGIHATLVGVVLGLMAPTRAIRQREMVDADMLADISTPETARETVTLARESVSTVEWLEQILHPWTSFLIVPLFALANAGVLLNATVVDDALTARVTWGVVAGLVAGKLLGVTLFTWLAVRLRIGTLPEGARWSSIVGVGALAGIGFTVSIFVAGLAFDEPRLTEQAKIGILIASIVAGLLGASLLARSGTADTRASPDRGQRAA
ncbi:MAG: Na+/H+ antiporter NhaA, partial [Acidimicrobiia bacterium]